MQGNPLLLKGVQWDRINLLLEIHGVHCPRCFFIVFFPKCPMSKPVVLTVTGCLKMEAVCRMGGTRDESCFVKSCVPGFASVAVGAVAEDEL